MQITLIEGTAWIRAWYVIKYNTWGFEKVSQTINGDQ